MVRSDAPPVVTTGSALANPLSCLACLVLLTSCFGTPVSSQEVPLRVEYLTIKEGLSSNRVWDFWEDDQGFIWIATGYGLNRFDGYTCTTYGQLIIGGIFIDKKGRFWLSDVAGSSYRFDRVTGRVTHYPILGSRHAVGYTDSHQVRWVGTWGNGLGRYVDSLDSFVMYTSDQTDKYRIACDTIYSIGEDSRGRLLVGTKNGLEIYDKEGDTFDHWVSGPNLHINSIMEDSKGTLWLSTEAGLCEANLEKGSFKVYRNIDTRWSALRTLLEDSRGDFWVTSLGGVSRFDRETGRFQNFDRYLPENFSRGTAFPRHILVEDSSGNIWAGVHNILARFDRARQDMVLVSLSSGTSQASRSVNWSQEVTTQIYVDRAGTVWFGRFDGAARIVKTQKSFVEFSFDGLSPAVLSMREDRDGVLWFGKDDGLLRADERTGTRKRYTWDPHDPRTMSGNVIQNIVEGGANTLWLGIGKMGINRFDKSSGLCIRYFHDPANPGSLPYDNIGGLFLDHEGTLWAGPEGGLLSKFDPENGTFTNVLVDPVRRADITVIYEDRSSTLWVGADGLRAFNPKTGNWRVFHHDPGVRSSLSNDNILAIYEDSLDVLWVGTSNGLNRLERVTGTFSHISEEDGLAHPMIAGIQEDSHHTLWLLTARGISTYNPQTGQIKNYDENDGVDLGRPLRYSSMKRRNGEMFFGGTAGCVRFFPESIRDNPFVPRVVITSIQVNHTPLPLDTTAPMKKAIRLSHSENVITLEFAALNYASPKRNRYSYKLEGFDPDWIPCGTRRSATYTNLDGGSYVFRVKGSNNDGVWNEEGASIAITITPPPWKTVWAYLAYASFAGAVLWSIRRYQINKLKARHQLEITRIEANTLKEVDHLKSRFFANISHEFRTPLTLIEGPLKLMKSGKIEGNASEYYDLMLRNTQRLERLVNQILDLSRIESGNLRLKVERMDLVEAVRGMAAAFESLAKRKGVQYTIQTGSDPIVGWLDRDVLEKIVTNLLSNAFKFTRSGGEVRISLRMDAMDHPQYQGCFIEVYDTGIGMPSDQIDKIFDRFYQVDTSHTREQEGSGLGLALTKELIELHKGSISVRSELGVGSTFTVWLPLGSEHWKAEEIVHQDDGQRPVTPNTPAFDEPERAEQQAEPDDESEELPLVLIIEDNADMRKYMRKILDTQFRVMESVDGEDGIRKAATTIPDLVVCDVMMPKADGFEVSKRLKSDEKTSHIPIILLTAKAGNEHKLEGLKTGADDYLIKPFDARELLVRGKNLIEQRQKLRERFRREITLQPHDISITPMEERFLNRAKAIVENHLSDTSFGVEPFAAEMALSRSQLHRKLFALTGVSPGDFIRSMRLQRAAQLLRQHFGTVTEVAYEVGFSNPSHFTESFRKQFGVAPSEYPRLQS